MRRFIAWKQAVVNRIIKRPWIVGVSQTLAPPPFNPADMFTNNEPGWIYDLSDFSTLFQDSAGATPVTAVEQPVGLVLDKSQGLVLGPETYVAMDNITTGWVDNGDGTYTATAATTAIEQTATSGDPYVVGRMFIFEYEIISRQAGSVRAYVNGSGFGPERSTPGAYADKCVAVGNLPGVCKILGFGGFTGTVRPISVKLLPGNHASQPTTTKRPVLKVDGNGKYYLKGDGVDDFLSTAAIDFTGADSVTIWQGVQKLSDTESAVLCELGAESITLNGTFGLFAPEPSGTGYMFNSRGTSRAFVISPSNPAPHKCVLTAQGRISTDTCAIQIDEGVVMTNAADQGINAYTLNPVYFGARGGTSNFFGGQQYSSVCIGKPGVTPEELYNTRTWVNDRTGAY